MKIALIHNPNAFRGETEGSDLRRIFKRAGHDLIYASTKQSDWQIILSQEIALAIIAGGDGTVQEVAPHLKGTPFSILPCGTANNIAQCLQQTPNAELLASQLNQAHLCPLDVGTVMYGLENRRFLEGTGIGAFVELILVMRNRSKKIKMKQAKSRTEKFAHALERLQAIGREYEGVRVKLKADDTVIEDRFILMAAMNMELIGPRLHLAPNADPADGYLDLVLVREKHRESFCRWLECQIPGQKKAADLERRRCRRVEMSWTGVAPIHIDSHLVRKPQFPILIETEPTALEYAIVKPP